jgi:hypothetical protein
MRFTDFLRLAVLISAGAATALAAASVAGAEADGAATLEFVLVGWWVLCALFGTVTGRRPDTSPAIAKLLGTARSSMFLPDLRPGRVLINRLWPLALMTIAAGALAFLVPQVPGIAAGFAIIWALAWRRQAPAVTGVEDRDGVRFYVERTSPIAPITLLRTPGFQATLPSRNGGGSADRVADRLA